MLDYHQKILMIGWEYPPHNSGGLGVACQGLTKALAGQNSQIYFTLPYRLTEPVDHMQVLACQDPAWQQSNQQQPPFRAYDQLAPIPHSLLSHKLNSHQLRSLPQSEIEQKVADYAQVVEKQVKQIRDEFDVIHAHDWMSFPAAVNLKKQTQKPLITHIHSTERDRTPNGYGSNYIEATEREGMMLADRVVAVSYYTKRLLVQDYGVDPHKIEVVHNGVEPLAYTPQSSRSHFAPKRPVIVFMGRLTNQKGAHFFINVGQQVISQIPEALFVLAGSGHLYHELLLQAASQQLTAHVLFSGFVRGQQKRRLLERADAFVMPSLSEPFGLVALEAAQHQTPVIVSTNSGVSEILTNSIQVDFWDEDKMAAAIINLISHKQLTQQLVQLQLQDLNQASWDQAASKLQQVYRRAFLGR